MSRLWEVVGGVDKGGILVRAGQELSSPLLPARLATGAVVEEAELLGDRLRYRRRAGKGPDDGWVSLRLPGNGKELLMPTTDDSGVQDAPESDSRHRDAHAWPTHPLTDEEWEEQLSEKRYVVLRGKGTEPAFSGEYNNFFPTSGHFKCAGCNTPLYSTKAKMQEGCGWPAFGTCFKDGKDKARVVCQIDLDAGEREILCRRCGGHLGHVFLDGAPHRHCVNSLSIVYDEAPAPLLDEGLCDMTTYNSQLKRLVATGNI